MVYHNGVAVNDYRYLASGYVLTLDWGDPWYSSFNTRNLARQYSAPMSGFIYVENFEVGNRTSAAAIAIRILADD